MGAQVEFPPVLPFSEPLEVGLALSKCKRRAANNIGLASWYIIRT